MSCDLHTPLWVFTAPPLIPLHTLGAYLHTPSNPAPDNRKNAPPLWQRCAFVSSFSTFANSKIPAAPPLPAEPRAALLPDSGFTVLHQTITSQKNLRKKARRPAVPSSALNFPAKIPPSTAPQLKAPPHPEPPAPRTGRSGYPAPGTAPPFQPRPPGDRARRHRKGCGSHRPCAPGGTAGAACP